MPHSVGTEEVQLCNANGDQLVVWLEPWAQEFVLSSRGLLLLRCVSGNDADPLPEIETSEQVITIWGRGGSRIAVFIDGVDQDSFSAGYAAPDTGPLSARAFVNLVFAGSPEARPGDCRLRRLGPKEAGGDGYFERSRTNPDARGSSSHDGGFQSFVAAFGFAISAATASSGVRPQAIQGGGRLQNTAQVTSSEPGPVSISHLTRIIP